MYLYRVKIKIRQYPNEKYRGESRWKEVTIMANTEDSAIRKARNKLRDQGYQLDWDINAPDPIVEKL